MAAPATDRAASLQRRLAAFVLERFPFARAVVDGAVGAALGASDGDESDIERLREPLRRELSARLRADDIDDLPDPTPRTTPRDRFERARQELLDACDGFLRREAIASSLT